MGPIEFCKRESALIGRHPWEFITAAAIAGGLGFTAATFWDAGELSSARQETRTAQADRDIAKNCRNSGSDLAPCPVDHNVPVKWKTKVETKTIADPAQAAEIEELKRKLAAALRKPTAGPVLGGYSPLVGPAAAPDGSAQRPFMDPKDCPKGASIISRNRFEGPAVSVGAGAVICYFSNDNKTVGDRSAVTFRDPQSDPATLPVFKRWATVLDSIIPSLITEDMKKSAPQVTQAEATAINKKLIDMNETFLVRLGPNSNTGILDVFGITDPPK